MPNYTEIPTLETWEKDSSAVFAFRSSDLVLGTIDSLVAAYHDVSMAAVQRETLYYLRSALVFWLAKLNAVPRNTPPTGMNTTNLPATPKVSGSERRASAITDLLGIVEVKLQEAFAVHSTNSLKLAMVGAYGATNHGVAADQDWLNKPGKEAVSTFLTDAGLQRMYKLRYRGGVARRWDPRNNVYTIFDTTDRFESELHQDDMTHFVMSHKGGIYAGYDNDKIWFKHSSFLGGSDVLAAGRMKVEQGVVTLLQNDSGHYSPNYKHMVNVLQRLRLYNSNLTNTRVMRHSDRRVFTAQAMLAHPSSWPDGAMGF